MIADIINLKNFGAQGDGSTDDTAAINAAINACVNSANPNLPSGRPAELVFPRGIYLYGNPAVGSNLITFHHNNHIVRFESGAILMPHPKASRSANVLVTGQQQTFYNLAIRDDLQPTGVGAGALEQLLEVQGSMHQFFNIQIFAQRVEKQGIRVGRWSPHDGSKIAWCNRFWGGWVHGRDTQVEGVSGIFLDRKSDQTCLWGLTVEHWETALRVQEAANLTVVGNDFTNVSRHALVVDTEEPNAVLSGILYSGNCHSLDDRYCKNQEEAAKNAFIYINGATLVGGSFAANSFDTGATVCRIKKNVSSTNNAIRSVIFSGNKCSSNHATAPQNSLNIPIFDFEGNFPINILDIHNTWGDQDGPLVAGGGADKLLQFGTTESGRALTVSAPIESLKLSGGGRWSYGTNPPVNGDYHKGDIVWNINPVPNGTIGWVCTIAGKPSEWKCFGAISG